MPALRIWQVLCISLRNFSRFRLQAALIVASAITGTAGVLISTGYAAGGRQKILDQFARLGTNVIVVTPEQSHSVGGRARTGSFVTTLNRADYRAIREMTSEITAASPTVAAVLRIRAGDLTKNTTVIGCEPDYFQIKNWPLTEGNFFDQTDDRRQARIALIGSTAARDLFGAGDPTGEHIAINRVPFTVVGVLAERGQGLDAANEDDQIYVPLQTAMRRLINVDYFVSILFRIDAVPHMDEAAQKMTALLEQRHKSASLGRADFQVQNQQRLLDAQLAAFERLTFLIRWIAVSALAVSSLGVLAVTWIGVRNRTREIGVRRSIGARRADILMQFLGEGVAGAFAGCSAGFAIGYAGLRIMDARSGQPFLFSALAAAAEAFGSMALFSISTAVSALRAIGVEPSVASRTE